MKLFIISLFILSFTELAGQDLSFSAGVEKTVAGTEFHVSSGYVTRKNWSLGGFHQMKLERSTSEDIIGSQTSGNGWYGVYVNAPIANTKKINVFFQLRTGISENKFIVVVPSIETNINLSKVISVSIGSSYRYSYPGVSLKTNIRPFNFRKR
jgi:hypothetical protein